MDSPWDSYELPHINTSLALATNVTGARVLIANEKAKKCFQGQNPVNAGFFLTPDEPGDNPLRTAQARLDTATRTAYGFAPKADPLAALLELNLACATKEKAGEKITPPGLPLPEPERTVFITNDSIHI